MKRVKIKGKTYIAGLKWYSFDDKERAKEKLQELEYGGILRHKEKDLWMVYGSEEKAKGLILASGFLHLPSGYYYINLEDGSKWILLKGTDGGIVYEDVVKDFQTAEEEHHEFFIGFYDASGKIKREEITIEEGKDFKAFGGRQISFTFSGNQIPKKHLIAIGISLLVIAGGFFILMSRGNKPIQKQIQVPMQQRLQQAQQLLQNENQKEQSPPPSGLSVGNINIKECFENFYKKGKCETKVTGNKQEVSTNCKEVLRSLQKLEARGTLIWGETKQEGEYSMYSFSLSGDFLMKELKFLSEADFVQGEMKIEGDMFNPQITILGVLACK